MKLRLPEQRATDKQPAVHVLCLCADLLRCTLKVFVFGGAAQALSQIRPGAVVALLRCRWDDSGRDSLKILDADNVRDIGTSADMAACKGVTKNGEPCRAVVNRRMHGAYCDAHLEQVCTTSACM